MTDERLPSGQLLAATARWAAAVRAKESARPDRLFDDPWAAALAGPEGQAWIDQRPPASFVPMTLRTRFFDDWLRRLPPAAPSSSSPQPPEYEGGVRANSPGQQVVIVAAGLDTRAYRLDWADGTIVFELDQPEVLDYKERVLGEAGARSRAERRRVAADLAADWAACLLSCGFQPSQPSTWLLEGLLFYLPTDSGVALLDGVTNLAAPGSAIGFDCVNGAMLTSPWTREWVEMQAKAGAPWLGTLDDPVGFLAKRGWRAAVNGPSQPEVSHGRWTLPVVPIDAPGIPQVWFITGTRAATK